MGVKSQHAPSIQQTIKTGSQLKSSDIPLPDSTKMKIVVRAKRLDNLDSLLALDSILKASNDRAIINVKRKIARFEEYRKTPRVEQIPQNSPSLAVVIPAPSDSIPLKKKDQTVSLREDPEFY